MPTADSDDLSSGIDAEANLPAELIHSELARIMRSKAFLGSPRHREFLKHLVENALAGNTGALKEAVLAIDLFKRSLQDFDHARDSIVRVEARRLRQRLARYYEEEGNDVELEIRLPVGSYVPTLRHRGEPVDSTAPRLRDLVERGEYFLRQPLSKATLEAALARFDAALRESPEHVPALVGAGRAWFNLAAGWYGDPRPAAEHAAEALRRALHFNREHAVAHTLLGAVLHQFEYDWKAARVHFTRAIVIAPREAFVHSAFGFHLLARAETDAAERELLLARRMDPHYANTRMHVANLRICQRRLDDAEVEIEGMQDIAPDNPAALGLAALLAMVRGTPQVAMELYARVCEIAPEYPNAYACFAAAQGMMGDIAAADETLDAAFARFGEKSISPYVLAIVATRCGRHDRAFTLLEDAIECRDPNVLMLGIDLSFADLHDDLRWGDLLARRRANPRAQSSG